MHWLFHVTEPEMCSARTKFLPLSIMSFNYLNFLWVKIQRDSNTQLQHPAPEGAPVEFETKESTS